MPDTPDPELTALLEQWNAGDRAALDRMAPVVYDQLRRTAAAYLRPERQNHTLQPTALVNEVYLRIAGHAKLRVEDRAHFFALAARLMRQILVDHARSRLAGKRGGAMQRVTLEDIDASAGQRDVDLLALDAALAGLAELDPVQSRVVELRYFAGLTMEETAEVMEISRATVGRHWATARLWLKKRIQDERT